MTPKSVEEEKIQRRLKREVLQQLKDHGAINFNTLYIHFDPNMTAHLAPVLQDLREWQHIELDKKDMVKITTAGLRLLEDTNYWIQVRSHHEQPTLQTRTHDFRRVDGLEHVEACRVDRGTRNNVETDSRAAENLSRNLETVSIDLGSCSRFLAVSTAALGCLVMAGCAPRLHCSELLSPQFGGEGTLNPSQVVIFHGCHDGDTCTFTLPTVPPPFGNQIPIRLAGVDTPEIHGKCDREKVLARKAQAVTTQLLSEAKQIELVDLRRD